ncbi:hypothetical protein D3C87_1407930 [compost metagenome]
MLGDAANDIQHLTDVLHTSGQLLNTLRGVRHAVRQRPYRNHRFLNLLTTALCGLLGHPGRFAGADRIACDLVDGRRHLIDRRRSLFDLQPLQLQTAAGLAADRAQFFGRTGHLIDRCCDVLDHRVQALLHLVHVHHHAAVGTCIHRHLNRQIALRDLAQEPSRIIRLSTQMSGDATRYDERGGDD